MNIRKNESYVRFLFFVFILSNIDSLFLRKALISVRTRVLVYEREDHKTLIKIL